MQFIENAKSVLTLLKTKKAEMANYVYQKGPRSFHVGFYNPENQWIEESKWLTARAAACRVAWLNGSGFGELINDDILKEIIDEKKKEKKTNDVTM